MTGGDKQVARFLHQDFFEFESTAKFVLAFNHKPEINDDSRGMARRIQLIPFNKRFEGKGQDKTLKETLRAELSAILAWAVRGCLEWQRQGLNPPSVVLEATETYQKESNVFGNFIEECCVVGEGLSVSSSNLRNEYSKWAAENGASALDARVLKNRLEARGFKCHKIGHARTRGYLGLNLKCLTATKAPFIK